MSLIDDIVAQANASGKMEYAVEVEFTPELAADLLHEKRKFEYQRPLKKAYLNAVCAVIRAEGGWRAIGERVLLNRHGVLWDGQHRMEVVVRTGIGYRGLLVVTQDDKAFPKIDTGKSRRVIDFLRHLGLNGMQHAAVMLESLDFPTRTPGMLTTVKADRIEAYDLLDYAKLLTIGRVTSGQLAAALRCVRLDEKRALPFFEAVFERRHHLDPKTKTHVPLLELLVTKLADLRARPTGTLQNQALTQAYVCLKAFRAHYEGRTVAKLTVPSELVMPISLEYIALARERAAGK